MHHESPNGKYLQSDRYTCINTNFKLLEIVILKGENNQNEKIIKRYAMVTNCVRCPQPHAEGQAFRDTQTPFSKKNRSSYLANYRYSTLGVLQGIGWPGGCRTLKPHTPENLCILGALHKGSGRKFYVHKCFQY